MKRAYISFWLDQYGNKFKAQTRKELIAAVGGGRVQPMYINTVEGKTVHVGYVVGSHWLTPYAPVELHKETQS